MTTSDREFESSGGGLLVEDDEAQKQLLRKPIELASGLQIFADPDDSVSARSSHEYHDTSATRLSVYSTQPAISSNNPPHIIVLPGFIEHAGYGIGKKLQHTAARYVPHAHFHGIATDGFGPNSDRYGYSEREKHNLKGMGVTRSEYIEEVIPENSQIYFISTSMGTIITKEVVLNLDEDRLSNVAGGVLNACALVERGDESDRLSHIRKFGRFLFSVIPDAGLEVAKTPPHRLVSELISLWQSGHLSPADILPLAHLGIDILAGSEPEDIDDMLERIAHSSFTVLIGTDDPVAEHKMWLNKESLHDNLSIYPVHGRSHGIVLNPVRNARVIAKILYDTTPLGFEKRAAS